MTEPLPIVLVPGLLCSARLYAEQIPGSGGIRAGDGRRPSPRRHHGGDRGAHSRRRAAALCARRALDGRLHRSRDPAPGARAGRAARVARHQRARRYAGTDRSGASAQIELAQTARLRRDRRSAASALRASRPARRCSARSRACAHGGGHRRRGLRAPADGDHDAAGFAADLAEIKCPTLVLVGDGDQLTPPKFAKEIAGGIAGAHLVVVPACGHLSTLEQPEAVNKALVEWMAA